MPVEWGADLLGSTASQQWVQKISGMGTQHVGTVYLSDGLHNLTLQGFPPPNQMLNPSPVISIVGMNGYYGANASNDGGALKLFAGSAIQASSGTAPGGNGADIILVAGNGAYGRSTGMTPADGGDGGHVVALIGEAGGYGAGGGSNGSAGDFRVNIDTTTVFVVDMYGNVSITNGTNVVPSAVSSVATIVGSTVVNLKTTNSTPAILYEIPLPGTSAFITSNVPGTTTPVPASGTVYIDIKVTQTVLLSAGVGFGQGATYRFTCAWSCYTSGAPNAHQASVVAIESSGTGTGYVPFGTLACAVTLEGPSYDHYFATITVVGELTADVVHVAEISATYVL